MLMMRRRVSSWRIKSVWRRRWRIGIWPVWLRRCWRGVCDLYLLWFDGRRGGRGAEMAWDGMVGLDWTGLHERLALHEGMDSPPMWRLCTAGCYLRRGSLSILRTMRTVRRLNVCYRHHERDLRIAILRRGNSATAQDKSAVRDMKCSQKQDSPVNTGSLARLRALITPEARISSGEVVIGQACSRQKKQS